MQANKEPVIDITIQSGNDEVIILKGPPETASPVLLSGIITLSTCETVKVKSVSLRLTGRMTYNVPIINKDKSKNETTTNTESTKMKHLAVDKWLYHHKWDDFSIDNYFKGLYKNYQTKTPIMDSKNVRHSIVPSNTVAQGTSTSIKNGLIRPKSTTSLLSMKTNTNIASPFQRRKSHTLLKGKYEFPFTSILPGDINETIDGLPNTNVSYYLEAIIERTNGKSDLYCRKYIRIVRTITPDIAEISETVNVTDTWTNRIFYSISVGAKTLAIGSKVPINISVIPLKSGLRLGTIRISLYETAEYYYKGTRTKIDRVVSRMKIENPEKLLVKLIKDDKFQEKWELDLPFRIPASLSKCTQDCIVMREIRVTHKFKCSINFYNEDGHVSKIKANVPVSLFISEFVPLKVRRMESTTDFTCITKDISSQIRNEDAKETIFEAGHVGLVSPQYDNESILPVRALNELLAPPEYENHVFDRRFCNDMDVDSSMLPPPSDVAPDLLPYEPNEEISTSNILKDIDLDNSNHRRMSDASCQTMPEFTFASLDTAVEEGQNNETTNDQQQIVPNLENYTFGNSHTNNSHYYESRHNSNTSNNIQPSDIDMEPLDSIDIPPPSYMEDDHAGNALSQTMSPIFGSIQDRPRRFRSTSLTNPFPSNDVRAIAIPVPAHTINSSQSIIRSLPQVSRRRNSSVSSNNPFLNDIVVSEAFGTMVSETIQRFSPIADSSSNSSESRDIFNLPTNNQIYHTFSEPYEKLNALSQRRYSVSGTIRNSDNDFISRKNILTVESRMEQVAMGPNN